MLSIRLWPALVLSAGAYAAGDPSSALQAANLVERNAGRLPAPLAIQFRMSAAVSLHPRYPEMARNFVDATLEAVRAGKAPNPGPDVVGALAELAPGDAIAILRDGTPSTLSDLIGALAQTNHIDEALALYRSSFSRAKVRVTAVSPVIAQLARERPREAAALFQESVAAFSFDNLEPRDAWWLITTAGSAASASPHAAADLYVRILAVASAPGYGDKSKSSVTAVFRGGSATIATANSRDTLLLAAAVRLRALAPERLEEFRSVLSRWDLALPVALAGYTIRSPGGPARTADPGATAIGKSLSGFRGLPTDRDRARVALELAGQIRALPGGAEKVGLAEELSNLSTEGDLGKDALAAVAGTLAQAIRETSADARGWLDLAGLVRYEHVPVPYSDPALDAADSVLALRQTLAQEAGFTLSGLDGKTWSLSGLRGRVVLLNFWATWCPPCRKEMPDMEKLYRTFERRGLTVLAVSDEDRDTVTAFLQKRDFTFPILLDPGRKAHTAFSVEGIPKSFLFDRDGKLVAEAIDMRTERQFLEMLRKTGLE